MKYFLAVAEVENVNQAAKTIHISAGSLSKAISRLEEELSTQLFFRVGRGIKLTPEGRALKVRAAQIISLEEDARYEIRGKDSEGLNIYISSEEILQTTFGLSLIERINKFFPKAKTQFLIREESKAIDQLRDGEAHLVLVSGEAPKGIKSKKIAQVEFQTCASEKHPLVKKHGTQKVIHVNELLEHAFVSPDSAMLGQVSNSASTDGWRDDKFPRKIQYKVCGLKFMENLIHSGAALGYLPDYFIKESGLTPLRIDGCPYSCKQTVRVLTKNPTDLSWLAQIWDDL